MTSISLEEETCLAPKTATAVSSGRNLFDLKASYNCVSSGRNLLSVKDSDSRFFLIVS